MRKSEMRVGFFEASAIIMNSFALRANKLCAFIQRRSTIYGLFPACVIDGNLKVASSTYKNGYTRFKLMSGSEKYNSTLRQCIFPTNNSRRSLQLTFKTIEEK